ncbi:hypothetical protein MMC29_005435 [Sticta canariensis]|nr:hypothetical protein [Sticta canariensis]
MLPTLQAFARALPFGEEPTRKIALRGSRDLVRRDPLEKLKLGEFVKVTVVDSLNVARCKARFVLPIQASVPHFYVPFSGLGATRPVSVPDKDTPRQKQ